jgi:hypothetical protein
MKKGQKIKKIALQQKTKTGFRPCFFIEVLGFKLLFAKSASWRSDFKLQLSVVKSIIIARIFIL